MWLEIDKSLLSHDDTIWNGLSFTRNLEMGSIGWTGKACGSYLRLDDRDGDIEKMVAGVGIEPTTRGFSDSPEDNTRKPKDDKSGS